MVILHRAPQQQIGSGITRTERQQHLYLCDIHCSLTVRCWSMAIKAQRAAPLTACCSTSTLGGVAMALSAAMRVLMNDATTLSAGDGAGDIHQR